MFDREIANDFMYETDAGAATWLLGVLSNLKPVAEGGGDELIFQKASEMLKRISGIDGIDPVLLDQGEGRLRSTDETDTLTEAYVRAFEVGQCVTDPSPHLSAYAAGYLLGLRPNGIVGLHNVGGFSQSDRENARHGGTVDVLLGDAGFAPPGDHWGDWEKHGQVTDDGFADPACAAYYRHGVKAARDAADTYLVLRSLADDQ